MGKRKSTQLLTMSFLVVASLVMAPRATGEESPLTENALGPPLVLESAKHSGTPLHDGGLRALVAGAESLDGLTQAIDGSVRVEVRHSRTVSEMDELIEALGGAVEGRSPGLVLALVPIDRLVELESSDGIEWLRSPVRVDHPEASTPGAADSFDGEEISKTGAAEWHAAGITGEGIKVGIIDGYDAALWATAQANGELPSPTGTFCRAYGSNCNLYDAHSAHGVMVAEVIHEMAPDAELYLGLAMTTTDLQAVVDYFDSQGVDIISRSLGADYDGPGDGTGPLADVVKSAVAKGMTWINSVGNAAGGQGNPGWYWRGQWVDADNDGYLDFGPGDRSLGFWCGSSYGLRWSDWGTANPTDYDMYVYDDPALTVLKAASLGVGQPPLENVDLSCSGDADADYLVINKWDDGNGTSGDVLEFMVHNSGFEYWQNPHSATQPVSDSASAGLLAVGAIDPPNGTAIAYYSSQGPTNDLRIKPDLTAAACLSLFTADVAGYPCFNGTSSATPVVAGAAALALDARLANSPAALVTWLTDEATVERGTGGADNVFGAGELSLPEVTNLPSLPKDETRPWWSDAAGLTPSDVLERDLTLTWSGAVDDTAVTGYIVKNGTTVIAEPGANARSLRVDGLQPDTAYVFSVEATDAAGNTSVDGPDVAVRTAPSFLDVTDTNVFHDDIAWLAGAGVTQGCNPPTNDRFCPNDSVTRGQMAAFLVRALALPPVGGFDFVDDDSSVFEEDIERLAGAGITQGCNPPTNDRFCPNDSVTRGQMAAFLHRALD